MRAHQGETGGLAVIEAGVRPARRVVAQAAVRPKLAIVGIIGLVAGSARLRKARPVAIGVTRFTGQVLMRADQLEPGQIVIETRQIDLAPRGCRVAYLAVRAKAALVGIVLFMAANTSAWHRRRFPIDVARAASDLQMRSGERESCLPMIEMDVLPG